MILVTIDARRSTGWEALHDTFAEAFGFPEFYGRNMNAWIDCMTCLDEPEAGMTHIHAQPGGVVALQLDHADELRQESRELYDAIIEGTAFVNWRRIERGYTPVLALSF